MRILDLFTESGLSISLENKGTPFPVRIIRLYLPILVIGFFHKYCDLEDNEKSFILKAAFPSEFCFGFARYGFAISLRVLGIGIEYYYQWSY